MHTESVQNSAPPTHTARKTARSVVAASVLTLLICFGMTARQLHRPNLADFEVYDAAAELVHEHRSTHIYDGADTGDLFGLRFVDPALPLGQAARKLGIAQVRLYIYPPILADMLVPFTLVPASTAGKLWLVLNVFALLGTAWFTAQSLRIRALAGATLALGLFVLFSTLFCLIWGQITIVLLLLWAAGLYFYQRGRHGASAFCFAMATAIKLTPLLVVMPFLIWREWRWLRAYAVSLLALIGVMAVVNTPSSLADYALRVMPSMSAGGMPNFENKSLLSSAQLVYVGLHGGSLTAASALAVPHGLIALAKAGALALVALAVLLVLRLGTAMRTEDRLLALALFALLSVCVAPISWKHAYIVAFLPLAMLWAEAFHRPLSGWSLALLTLCSIELGSFVFDSVAVKALHGQGVLLGFLSFLAPGAGLLLVIWKLLAMRPEAQPAR